MTIKRFGAGEKGLGDAPLPFARSVQADGWLYVSGQVPMRDGEIVAGGIGPQTVQAIDNLIALLHEAGYGVEHVVRVGVWLEDARDFGAFNAVYAKHFPKDPPARTTVESRLMIDIKIEVEAVAYRPV